VRLKVLGEYTNSMKPSGYESATFPACSIAPRRPYNERQFRAFVDYVNVIGSGKQVRSLNNGTMRDMR
jgi:hypothetical protein